jgi:ribosomal-protein-alanine N-acetyltransferase
MNIEIPKLKSNRVVLRPLNSDDYKLLFKWQSNAESIYMWWARRIMTFDEFIEDFQRRLRGFFHQIFMIDYIDDGKPITVGMTFDYQYNPIDKYAYLCIYFIPEYTAKGLGFEAGYTICEYLFANYGLRKIYTEILDFNAPSLKLNMKNLFKQEGLLKEHQWIGDRYWDLHILALTLDDFKKIIAPPR